MRIPIVIVALILCTAGMVQGARVTLGPQGEGWRVLVDGRPFRVLGAGAGLATGLQGEDFLKMAADLGATTVRTWGVDQGTQAYLDRAHALGLKVAAGIWLEWITPGCGKSYIGDTPYKKKAMHEALAYVRRFRNHPAVLFWGLGNEVFAFTKDNEPERKAFARFLNELAVAIKKIDPDHPAFYTSAALTGLPYIIRHAPAIDIFGMNIYGGVATAVYNAANMEVDGKKLGRPVLVTELGPDGPWDSGRDQHGMPVEPPDHVKAVQYRMRVKVVLRSPALGVFAFHLGDTSQESMTWWNINFGTYRLAPCRVIEALYKGRKSASASGPVITAFEADRYSGKAGGWIRLQATVAGGAKMNIKYFCSTIAHNVMLHYVNRWVPVRVRGTGTRVKLQLPGEPGTYRVYAVADDGRQNAAVSSFTVKVE